MGIVGGTQGGHRGHCFSDCHFLPTGRQMKGCCWGAKLPCSPSSLPRRHQQQAEAGALCQFPLVQSFFLLLSTQRQA